MHDGPCRVVEGVCVSKPPLCRRRCASRRQFGMLLLAAAVRRRDRPDDRAHLPRQRARLHQFALGQCALGGQQRDVALQELFVARGGQLRLAALQANAQRRQQRRRLEHDGVRLAEGLQGLIPLARSVGRHPLRQQPVVLGDALVQVGKRHGARPRVEHILREVVQRRLAHQLLRHWAWSGGAAHNNTRRRGASPRLRAGQTPADLF
eukprot:scaffold13373_cov102-Isochrysis_galbana.AAC.3